MLRALAHAARAGPIAEAEVLIGERRRFAPIPESPIHWSAASQEELCAWCCTAERIEVSPSRECTPELP